MIRSKGFFPLLRIFYNSQRNTFNFSLDKPLDILYNGLVVSDS